MNTILQFHIPVMDDRSVADVLTSEVIAVGVSDAVEVFGLDKFAMAFTAFGEQSSTSKKKIDKWGMVADNTCTKLKS